MEKKAQEAIEFTADTQLSFWARHRLSVLLILTVLITIVMTTISVIIYNVSGAAQLDLSRPGFRSISDKVEKNDNIDTYPSTGTVTKESIQEFMQMYDTQSNRAKSVDAFKGDPLNPEVLEFGTPNGE